LSISYTPLANLKKCSLLAMARPRRDVGQNSARVFSGLVQLAGADEAHDRQLQSEQIASIANRMRNSHLPLKLVALVAGG
ncbi:MAG: hypothetical protein P4L61_00580, partial [Candidatus Pacebacteria bacterium]|nr:hypothetical protein [Candidatus Paceibacterota bacterium]